MNRKRTWEESQKTVDPAVVNAKCQLNYARQQPGVKGMLVFVQPQEKTCEPFIILEGAASAAKLKLKVAQGQNASKWQTALHKPQTSGETWPTWNLFCGDEIIATGQCKTIKLARRSLGREALDYLERHCFTLIEKSSDSSREGTVMKDGSIERRLEQAPSQVDYGIGASMMAKMGWAGGGLGSQQQGTLDIVETRERVDRRGLGSDDVMHKINDLLKDLAKSNSLKSLVFSEEFSKEERGQIHMLARKNNLISKSTTKGGVRHLEVKCKLDRWHIVEQVMEQGGETDEYKLIYPTDI